MGTLKNGKTAGLDEVTGELMEKGGDWVCNWFQKLCTVMCRAFKTGTMPEDWKNGVIFPFNKGKGVWRNSYSVCKEDN